MVNYFNLNWGLTQMKAKLFAACLRAPIAIAVGLIATFPQPASALSRLLTSTEFETIRHALQADLQQISPSAKPTSDEQNALESFLGERLFSDKNLSVRRNQSCASCHQLTPAKNPKTGQFFQAPGFVDADNVEHGTPVSDGSLPGRFGNLNAPSAGYAAFSPTFHWDETEELYVGGQFWNGRAATLADQAAQPFLNPNEMAMSSKAAVVDRLKENFFYRWLFSAVYKMNIGRPLSASETDAVYSATTKAIAAFERTRMFSKFTSKFDYFMAGRAELTPLERKGLDLFNNKAGCAGCHISTPTKNEDGTWTPAMFTDFTYDNIGVPRNLNIPGNPEPDKGLGGRSDIIASDPQGLEIGKHKVMSLRNIAITPPYAHNGVFKTLEQITHFYNTRDTLGHVADNRNPGFGVTGWPLPEVTQNVNADELGNLGLTPQEEAAVVAFMKTLTDGYPYWGRDPRVPPRASAAYVQ
jgi:cytochrome c peroxidase